MFSSQYQDYILFADNDPHFIIKHELYGFTTLIFLYLKEIPKSTFVSAKEDCVICKNRDNRILHHMMKIQVHMQVDTHKMRTSAYICCQCVRIVRSFHDICNEAQWILRGKTKCSQSMVRYIIMNVIDYGNIRAQTLDKVRDNYRILLWLIPDVARILARYYITLKIHNRTTLDISR